MKGKLYKGAMVIQAFFLTYLRGLFWRCPGSSVATSAYINSTIKKAKYYAPKLLEKSVWSLG
jgi:hypothetical protein